MLMKRVQTETTSATLTESLSIGGKELTGGPETSRLGALEEAGALAVCLMPIGAEGPIVIQVARSKDVFGHQTESTKV